MKKLTLLFLTIMVLAGCNSEAQLNVTKPSPMLTAFKPANKVMPDDKGLNVFLSSPTQYSFKCGCDPGEMKTAKLSKNGHMKMTYFYLCGGQKLNGYLEGKYDDTTKQFQGIYNTENKLYYGTISIKWNALGEGYGSWDDGRTVGSIEMKLINKN